jgi:pimeloyl-ACP methyl ester carboxylesterase
MRAPAPGSAGAPRGRRRARGRQAWSGTMRTGMGNADGTTAPAVELACRDHPGGAPAIVALHGLASNARWWDLVAARLRLRLVAPDLRGHGQSPRPDTGYGFDAVTADVVALLDRLGIDRAVVAGHSWGASVALQLAADHPDRVIACVCVDGGIGDMRSRFPGGWAEAERALRPPDLVGVRRSAVTAWASGALAEGSDAATAAAILLANFEPAGRDGEHAGGADQRLRPRLRLERHMEIARALFDVDNLAVLERVRAPVVAVLARGPDSPWMAAKRDGAAAATAAMGDRLRVVWVDGGHDLPVQRPDAVARELEAAASA